MSEIPALPLFHRIEGKGVLVLGGGAAAEAKRRLVERAGGTVVTDADRAASDGVRLAFIAFEDEAACKAAAVRLRGAGILVNVVDRPDLCDFTTPSILERSPVLIAIGTAGQSAGLAKHLRLRLEEVLPQTLGKLAEALFAARERLRAAYPGTNERRRAIDAALEEGGPLDPLDPAAPERVREWAKGGAIAAEAATHMIVLSSEDPEDLTIRQARLLGSADAICCDKAVPDHILSRARADAVRRVCDAALCPRLGDSSHTARCPKAGPDDDAGESTLILRRADRADG
ncbi:NAD(P)-dependent oxidoreductase [Qipengyuania nanhaisediminis]|uniref:precorrin-2 dehydrogenase/sirohydrochlorin ferrochelatase family protein n=1 Tax=Qipengyuania nanhaisediminis TaxID=604088 RepID=UPI0038B38311